MAEIAYLEADDTEIYRFTCGQSLVHPYKAVAGRIGDRTIGIGGIYRLPCGEVWGFLDLRCSVPAAALYRRARRFLAHLEHVGVKSIKVLRADLPTSQEFLTRLDFHDTGAIDNGKEVWLWQK